MREGSLEVSEEWIWTGRIHGFPRVNDPLPSKAVRKLMEQLEDREIEPVIKIFPGNVFVKEKKNQLLALATRWARLSYVRTEVIIPVTDEQKILYRKTSGFEYNHDNVAAVRRRQRREEEPF
jgi:hypothetical protein